jgi:hypothetical protein
MLGIGGVEADPNKQYQLDESNGPWMVMACSFSGEGAEKQAHELVLELRKRYKLPAYVYKAHFALGEAQGKGVDKYGNPLKFQYKKFKDKPTAEVEEIAVLVGDFPAADVEAAQETLRKIKYAQPQCLELKAGKKTHQTLTGWRMIQRQVYEAIGSEKKKKGPMGHAFVTANPLLPPDYFKPRGIDPVVVALNKDVPYSLLDCPGKYSVQVATFKGQVIIQQKDIQDIESGRKEMESKLAEAAKKADTLTRLLREKGYEAYQFHDRSASIVTIGSFNSIGVPRPDGKIELDPRIVKILEVFGPSTKTNDELQSALKAQGLDRQTLATPVKSVGGIPLDVQPIPVEVPKRPVG